MKKKILFLLFFFLCLLFFRQEIINTCVKKGLSYYIAYRWKGTFTCTQFENSEKGWFLKDVHIKKKDQFDIEIHSLRIVPSFDVSTFQLFLHLDLNAPKINLLDPSLKRREKHSRVHVSLNIEKGQLHLFSKTYLFVCEQKPFSKKRIIHFKEEERTCLTISQSPFAPIKCEFYDFDLQHLQKFPISIVKKYQKIEGKLSGSLDFNLDQTLQDFSYDLVCKNLSVHSCNPSGLIQIEKIKLKGMYPKSGLNPKEHSLFRIIQKMHVSSFVENGLFQSSTGVYTHKISGSFSYAPQMGPKWEMQAIGIVDKTPVPIQMQGRGFFHPIFSNWLESKVQFGQIHSEISLKLKEIKSKSLQMECKGVHMDPLHISYIQNILSFFYKQASKVSLRKGSIDFECAGELTTFNPTVSNSQCLSGYLNIKDGMIVYEDPRYSFENVQATIEVVSGRICPSKITFDSDGIEGLIYVQGRVENPLIQAKIKGPFHPILGRVAPAIKKRLSGCTPLFFESGFTVKKEGFFGTFQFQTCKTNVLDTFSFGFILQDLLAKKRIDVRHGWIKGKNIGLDKYGISLKGIVNVFATFENRRMQMLVSGKEIKGSIYETDFTIKQLGSEDKELFNANECAQIQYGFSDQTLSIEVPLNKSACTISKYNLNFDEIYGKLLYEDNLLTVDVQKTKCEEANFSGLVLLENRDKHLQILTKKADGTVSSLHQILSKLSIELPLLQKLSGRFESEDNGFYFTTILDDPNIESQCKVQAKVQDGVFFISDKRSLQNLQANVFASSFDDFVYLKEIRAKMFVQSKKNQQVCDVYMPFLQRRKDLYHFDVRVSRPFWDMIQLVGSSSKKDSLYTVLLDNEKTQVLGEKLNVEELILEDIFTVSSLKMSSNIDLASFASQSAFFNELFFPDTPLDNMQFYPFLKGKIRCEIQYGLQQDSKIKMVGKDLYFNQKKIDRCLIEAVQKEKVWDFSKILIGPLSAKGVLSYENSQLEIKDFIANLSEIGSIKINCKIRDSFQINGEIDHLDLKADLFNQIFQKDLPLRGNIQGEGRFSIDLPHQNQKWQIESDLDIKTSTLLSHEFAVENINPLQIYFSLQEGLVIQGLNLHLFHPDDLRTWMKCKVGRLYYKAKEKKHLFSDLQLYLPKENLKEFIEKQHWIVPTKKGVDWLNCTQDLEICANGSFDLHRLKCLVNINEHHLHLKEKTYFLRDLSLVFQPNKLEGECKIKHMSRFIPLGFLINLKEMIDGNIHFKGDRGNPLTIQWVYDENIHIQSIEGSFQGVHASFHRQTQEPLSPFMGSLKVDLKQASNLAPPLLAQFFTELNMQDGYEFMGKLQLSPFTFDGIFSGRDCVLAGYVFKTLLSSIHIEEARVEMKDFKISDKSGIFKIDQIQIEKNGEDRWLFSIPNIHIKEFRPSFLQKRGEAPSPIKPLVVRTLNIYNLHGDLEDKKSYQGKGNLQFINSFKRGHTLMDIPADVLGRIFGLDMELLIPAKGSFEFDIHDQKFFIHSLKEVYSEGKRSKFFLVDEKKPHTLDFNGNLNVYIQMKHFVLFKFTEPFILSIEGSLEDPNFSLKTKKSFFSSK